MKKLITLLSFIVACSFSTVMAQAPGGGQMRDPAAMKARQLQNLKNSDLKLTDVQADSVVAVNMELMGQMRGLRNLTPEERQAKMKEVSEIRMKRLTSALQDEALAKKVSDFLDKQRMQRGGQGGQGGGTPPPPSNK